MRITRCVPVALALAATALAGSGTAALAQDHAPGAGATTTQPLVIRGADHVGEAACQAGTCRLELQNGVLQGTPLGTGAYSGAFNLRVARAFPNGQGGICAPVDGTLTLGSGTPDRLVLAFAGSSCQDGAGDLTTSSFTTLAGFRVVAGSGRYAHAHGSGLASFREDAQDDDALTLIGSLGA